jgi:hypothetical protein
MCSASFRSRSEIFGIARLRAERCHLLSYASSNHCRLNLRIAHLITLRRTIIFAQMWLHFTVHGSKEALESAVL